MTVRNVSSSSYKIEDVEAFGNRLHGNTLFSVIVNSLAIFLILKHSSKAIAVYKYYILSTIVSAFLMDFHLTFIWGWFPLFPKYVMCSAGIVKDMGYFWGNTVHFIFFHFTLSFCGLSLLFGFLYQYLSVINKADFLQTPKGFFLIEFSKLIYPLPTFYFFTINSNYALIFEQIKTNEPELLQFFIEASCNGYIFTKSGVHYLGSVVVQIVAVVIIIAILATKLMHLLSKMGHHSMSDLTLKMRKQLFIVLIIQMAAPLFIIFVPLILIITFIYLDIKNDNLYQICVQILSFHSVANALIVIFAIKSYRQVLLKWVEKAFQESKNFKRVLFLNHVDNSHVIFATNI